VPILGIVISGLLIASLPQDTWLRLLIWLVIGLTIYFSYSRYHSRFAQGAYHRDPLVAVGGMVNIAACLAAIWAYSFMQLHGLDATPSATYQVAHWLLIGTGGAFVLGTITMFIGSARKA
jgi:hypothetical protein